jgi:hypothetical protein
MSPRGEGDLDKSRRASGMLNGDRRSLEAVPFGECGGEAGIIGFERRLRAEGVVGDLDVRAEPELSPDESGWRCRRAADRVTGAR